MVPAGQDEVVDMGRGVLLADDTYPWETLRLGATMLRTDWVRYCRRVRNPSPEVIASIQTLRLWLLRVGGHMTLSGNFEEFLDAVAAAPSSPPAEGSEDEVADVEAASPAVEAGDESPQGIVLAVAGSEEIPVADDLSPRTPPLMPVIGPSCHAECFLFCHLLLFM